MNSKDIKKDKWTEQEILSLPSGEPNIFDRKSGVIVNDPDFEKKLAKAVSAFSNSSGGHLIIGVKDDCSIDGVSKNHKGRTQTREWLEQKIPFLVSPTLQDFRVHTVEPSNDTQIPADKTVIVIDIGDSILAPHQSNFDYHYYYRAGGHSAPAPHKYLELLWHRESYPGPRIAAAWVYKVINYLLSEFENEILYLKSEKWGFDRFHPDTCEHLHTYPENHSGNYEQFYESYPEILNLIRSHDEAVAEFIKNLEILYTVIRYSDALKQLFRNTTSPEALEKLKDKRYRHWNHHLQKLNSSDEIYKEVFSQAEKDQIFDYLSEYTLNETSKIDGSSLGAFWEANKGNYFMINAVNVEERINFDGTKNRMLEITQELIEVIKEKRKELCQRYQLPYDEDSQIIIQQQSSTRFGYQ